MDREPHILRGFLIARPYLRLSGLHHSKSVESCGETIRHLVPWQSVREAEIVPILCVWDVFVLQDVLYDESVEFLEVRDVR